METLRVVSSQKLAFESPRAVRAAAKMAGVGTAGKSMEQIQQAVIDAAAQIEFPPTPSACRKESCLSGLKGWFTKPEYPKVLFPTPFRPFEAAVVKIGIHNLKQEE